MKRLFLGGSLVLALMGGAFAVSPAFAAAGSGSGSGSGAESANLTAASAEGGEMPCQGALLNASVDGPYRRHPYLRSYEVDRSEDDSVYEEFGYSPSAIDPDGF